MNTRPTSNLLLAAGAGACVGYAAACTFEMLFGRRASERPPEKDAARYARVRRAVELAETVRSTSALLCLVHSPVADVLDRALAPLPTWLQPAAFAAVLALGTAIAEVPIAFVHDLELERRFGLTTRSSREWGAEYVKSSVLATGLVAGLAALLGAAVRRAPRTWPIYASLGTLPLLLLGNLVAPLYILPLFNAFEPLTGPLEERLRALATRFGVGGADILRMDMSKQTRKANAFVTGIGNTHRIVLGDTLIESFAEDEIAFVVAHELGHYLNRDTWRSIAAGGALSTALFLLAGSGSARNASAARRDRPSTVARIYATMLLWGLLLRPLLLAFSRSREWAADRFALASTRDPAGGAAAFRRLRDQNLADDDPPRWYEVLFGSHPSLRARIAALESA